MRNVVMGTAGHIDHGKTALVKRLTGVDTDRLEEEKRRGMTIELGFAPLTLPSGNVVSIIDVPGHEKFVKTMVAGVTGIDFVMLVVAADEGVMPQTVEHIDILSLLGIKNGVVALTKSDLVDKEWMELAHEDVNKALAGTSLEGIPVVAVSSVTGEGVDALLVQLEKLTSQAAKGRLGELFRLPVDRIFTITGHGTVVTGTVAGGIIKKGDIVELLPSGKTCRVRGIQVHNRNAEEAGGGDRCALNLSGVEKADINRGDMVVQPGVIRATRLVDAVVQTVAGKEEIVHNQRVHVHVGTKEVLARVRMLGADTIAAGERGYVQLRFEEPIAVTRKDRFIIRSYSPVDTIGGGWVIFHKAQNRQRFKEDSINHLRIGENGSLGQIIELVLKTGNRILSPDEIWEEILEDRQQIEQILMDKNNTVIRLKETGNFLSSETYEKFIEAINTEFEQVYKKYPFRYQIDREELKSKVFSKVDPKDFAALMNHLTVNNIVELDGNSIKHPGTKIIDRIAGHKLTQRVEHSVKEYGLNPKNPSMLGQALKIEPNDLDEILRFFIKTGRMIDLGEGILIHREHFEKAVSAIRLLMDTQGQCTAPQVRDLLETGRKTAIALLEYLDGIGFTQRIDDVRKPGARY